MDERIFANPALLRTWLWCLMKANHKDATWVPAKCGSGITEVLVNRGEFVFGRNSAAKKLHSTPSTIRNHLFKLESLGFLRVETGGKWEQKEDRKPDRKEDRKPDRQWTRVSIRNYELFSGRLEKEDRKPDRKEDRKEDTNKKVEKLEKDKKKKVLRNTSKEKDLSSPLASPSPTSRTLPDDAFMQSLKENIAYQGIDIDREIGKMQAWLSLPKNKRRRLTHQFMVNWLNGADRPVQFSESHGTQPLTKPQQLIKDNLEATDRFLKRRGVKHESTEGKG